MTELGESILALREQGMTYNQIVSETGASKGTVAYYCGAGQKEANLLRLRDRRNKVRIYIQKVKQESPCTDCGENYPYWIMDFDHVRGKKSFGVSTFQTHTDSLDVVKKEIAKCDLVCSNCHRNRTHSRLVKSGADVPDVSEFYE